MSDEDRPGNFPEPEDVTWFLQIVGENSYNLTATWIGLKLGDFKSNKYLFLQKTAETDQYLVLPHNDTLEGVEFTEAATEPHTLGVIRITQLPKPTMMANVEIVSGLEVKDTGLIDWYRLHIK